MVFCFATEAMASEAGAHSGEHVSPWVSFPFYIVNFTLFVLLIRYIYFRYVAQLVSARSDMTRELLSRAERELMSANEDYSIRQQRLSSIADEKHAMIERFDREGLQLARVIEENAIKTVERIGVDTRRQIEAELLAAKKELREKIILLATDMVQEQLSRELTEEVDRKLRNDAITRLSEVA